MCAYSAKWIARKNGYRSGLEDQLAQYLLNLKVDFKYEELKIEWEDLTYRTYTPDFVLPNGVIIETKGRFTVADRRKHLCIKQQHPELDIRFVFTNSKAKIRKGAKTSYANWCTRHKFKFCDRVIPKQWLKDKVKIFRYRGLIEFKGNKIKRR